MMWKGIIFDLDGVICSTDEYHYQAWKSIADALNIPFSREDNNHLRGVSRMASLDLLLKNSPRVFTSEEKEELAERKNRIYRKLLEGMTAEDLPLEVKQALDFLREKGLQLAIGSSSKNAPLILRSIGLEHYFDAVSDGNNIAHSKPHPEVFLEAADMLGAKPEDCLVVEDATAGVQAAHAGGMQVACLGDASSKGVGDFNMRHFADIIQLIDP